MKKEQRTNTSIPTFLTVFIVAIFDGRGFQFDPVIG